MGLAYQLALPDPASHLCEVTVEIPSGGAKTVAVAMPAWSPGSYLIRDYARMVRGLTARAGEGTLAVAKTDKQTWEIANPDGAAHVTVHYKVYAHELTVRTSHVDASHAFLHLPSILVHAPHLRREPCTIAVHGPADWAIATALERDGAGFRAAHVDELYDSPIHLGHGEIHRFRTAGCDVELALWGDRVAGGAFTVEQLIADLGAIIADHATRVGELPFSRYTFVLMLAHDAYGGLEHRASSANLHNPRALAVRKEYEGLLELLSHEFFHVWNGKRIAPPQLLDFDYAREANTRCLWVMEGLTSHYDRWALVSSKRLTAKSYLEKVLDDWTRLLAIPGRRAQSLEESSWDAWIKLYKPDESNVNTTVSYYLKGGLMATALDLEIRRRTEGARSLDDALRALWKQYGARGVGHPENVQPLFEEACGLGLDDVFARQIRGTEDPRLAEELAHVGLELRGVHDPALTADGAQPVWLGATMAGARVSSVSDGSPAAAAGLSPGDELCAIDGFRVGNDGDVRTQLGVRRPGDVVEVALFRRSRLTRLSATLAAAPPTRWEIAGAAEVPAEAAARHLAWIGEAHPGAGVVVTGVSCGARGI